MELLTGFRFKPTDEELITYFLRKKVITKEPFHEMYNGVLHEADDLLRKLPPWELWERYGGPHRVEQELYFFSTTETLHRKGSRKNRKIAAGGTWTEKDVCKDVCSSKNEKSVGLKRRLRYMDRKRPELDHEWVLEEYSLPDQLEAKTVVCRLRKNYKKKKSSTSRQLKEQPPTSTNVINVVDDDCNQCMISNNDHDHMLMSDIAATTSGTAFHPICSSADDEQYLISVAELLKPLAPDAAVPEANSLDHVCNQLLFDDVPEFPTSSLGAVLVQEAIQSYSFEDIWNQPSFDDLPECPTSSLGPDQVPEAIQSYSFEDICNQPSFDVSYCPTSSWISQCDIDDHTFNI